MMSRDQRERAYAAIGMLRRAGQREAADAVSQALAELHEYEVAPRALPMWVSAESMKPLELDLDPQDVKTPGEPEIYTYWVVYAYRENGGAQVLGTRRHTRSTPILTCEDRLLVGRKIADDTGSNVLVISVELMMNEEGR